MTARETIKLIDDLLHEWVDDPDMTTAEFVIVQVDLLVAVYLKRPRIATTGGDDE